MGASIEERRDIPCSGSLSPTISSAGQKQTESVNHSAGEYVRGEIHTANIDSFWSLIKRGIMGSFHRVSKTYLPLYLNEFSFRHNNRKNDDIFSAVVAGS